MLRDDASETRIKSAPLADYRVIHFATHGLVAGELDGLSEPALVLTPPRAATADDDGLLQALEIATLQLNADWVVLSACNTAAGDRVGADALSGLARAFLFAGARVLLVSHWAVYSDAAVHLTTQTFSELAQHPEIGRGEAFRRSMLALIDAGLARTAFRAAAGVPPRAEFFDCHDHEWGFPVVDSIVEARTSIGRYIDGFVVSGPATPR